MGGEKKNIVYIEYRVGNGNNFAPFFNAIDKLNCIYIALKCFTAHLTRLLLPYWIGLEYLVCTVGENKQTNGK